MLATWMRIKYPHILDGAIAGSAPIWSYLGEEPAYDSGSYAKIVTRDASEAGGSAPACASNVREVRDRTLDSASVIVHQGAHSQGDRWRDTCGAGLKSGRLTSNMHAAGMEDNV
jgi:hypothetical protein